jgi:hypothetical protein
MFDGARSHRARHGDPGLVIPGLVAKRGGALPKLSAYPKIATVKGMSAE